MNGKEHILLFLISFAILLFPAITYGIYWRILLATIQIPFLDPDRESGNMAIHRWWYSHSLFPAIGIWYCILPALNEMSGFVLCILIFYPMIHLIGDLGWGKSEADDFNGTWRISLFPIPKRLTPTWSFVWLCGNIVLGIVLLWLNLRFI